MMLFWFVENCELDVASKLSLDDFGPPLKKTLDKNFETLALWIVDFYATFKIPTNTNSTLAQWFINLNIITYSFLYIVNLKFLTSEFK